MKKIFFLLGVVGLLYVGYTVSLGVREKALIYFPEKNHTSSPKDLGLSYEDIFLKNKDGLTLHGWFFPNRGSKKTVLFFHGNAGNVSGGLDLVSFYLKKMGTQVFIIYYL